MIAVEDEKFGLRYSDALRRETFLRLIVEYQGALRRLAAAYVSDPHDHEDILQEIAVALWKAIPRFRGESSERTWLYRIAHNTAVTAATKLHRRGRAESALDDLAGPPVTADADEQLIVEQRREWLKQSIRELPMTDRQIMALHLEDLSHREIQEITGISEGAIATRLSRLRDRLTAEIRKQEVKQR
jgi:RNA polymerase sigma-70 factor, ECF subfamily